MGQTIIDGRGNYIAGGSEYIVGVTQDHKLMVDASVSVSAGSQSYIFGKSGASYYPLLSTSGTDGGVLRVDSSVSVSTGSEVYVKAGSIQTYNPIGIGSFLAISSAGSIGVYGNLSTTAGSEVYIKAGSVQTYNPIGVGSIRIAEQGVTLGISGIVNLGTQTDNITTLLGSTSIFNRVAGSIVNWPGSLAISNFDALGSTVVVNAPATIGSYTTQQISHIGSVEVFSSTGSVSVYGSLSIQTGSNVWIKGGSIFLYSGTTNYVNVVQETTPWIILGSVAVTSPISVSTGSEVYVKGGSILTYSGTNFVDIPNRVAGSIVNLPIGSNFTLSSPGSIGVFGTLGASGTLFAVSGIVNQGTNPWIVLGSVAISSPISVSVGSETYIKGGSIQTYDPIGVGSVTGVITIRAGSIQTYTPLGVGSVTGQVTIGAGSIQTYSPVGVGSVIITSARYDLGSFLLIAGSISSMPTISVSTGSESYIKGGSIQTYNPIGIGSVRVAEWGLTSPITSTGSVISYGIGSIRIAEQGLTLGISGIVNQGTTPWGISGTLGLYGYATGSIIRKNAGSPSVHYNLGTTMQSLLIDNLGSAPIYFMFGSFVITNTNAGSVGYIVGNSFRSFDIQTSSVSIIGSGTTTTPNVQVIGIM